MPTVSVILPTYDRGRLLIEAVGSVVAQTWSDWSIAVERGLITADASLDEHDVFALLFRPGFTTASVVTDLSGRGVGMDVVRTNVDAIGGTIDVSSRLGAGTTFTIRLPYRTHVARGGNSEWEETDRPIGLIA